MDDNIVGMGIDLTQHVPLVSFAVCPEAARANRSVDVTALMRDWPPEVKVRPPFCRQLPSALLPLMQGEPLLVAKEAAMHRRSAGLVWPPEAHAPYLLNLQLGHAA